MAAQWPPHFHPIDSNASTNTPWLVAIPGRTRERARYARPAGGSAPPFSTYGFSTGLTSTARPYACADQPPVAEPTARRQLNADVLSAAIDTSSLPRNAETGAMRRIGKRAA